MNSDDLKAALPGLCVAAVACGMLVGYFLLALVLRW